MVIQCSFCRARYWMKETIMEGGKGAKVRCRKCGGTFVVLASDTVPGVTASVDRRIRSGALPISRSLIDPNPPVPDNVYSLNRFRETRPARIPAGGYDISGAIRTWPSDSPAEQGSEEASPLPAPREEKRQMQNILPEEPARSEVENTAAPPDADPSVPSRKSTILKLSPPDRSQIQAGHTAFAGTRFTNIFIVSLLLLLLGGCGYLIIHFLFRMMD